MCVCVFCTVGCTNSNLYNASKRTVVVQNNGSIYYSIATVVVNTVQPIVTVYTSTWYSGQCNMNCNMNVVQCSSTIVKSCHTSHDYEHCPASVQQCSSDTVSNVHAHYCSWHY